MFLRSLLASFTLFIASNSFAQTNEEEIIKNKFRTMVPEAVIVSVTKSPLTGFHQVQLDSGKVFYISDNGDYLLQGYLFDIKDNVPKNLTTQLEDAYIARLINSIEPSKMVIYPAKGKTLTHITVFTDTSCPFCHRLHQDMPELTKQGVELRYLAFPREGLVSQGFEQMQKVWCAEDKHKAMDLFMKEQPITNTKKCNSPIVEHYILAQKIGIRGTPAIVLENGRIIPGYQAPSILVNEALLAKKDNISK